MNVRSDLKDLELYQLWIDGKSYREIGRRMGCSPNTVRTRIQRNKERFSKELFEREMLAEADDFSDDDPYYGSDVFI